MQIMTITDHTQLPELVDRVHDNWFDVEGIVYDRAGKRITFRVEPKQRDLDGGSSKGIAIEIRNVDELIITDTERVRYYDVNEITFNPNGGSLVLTSGIPIEIVFRISALEIYVSGP
jgi:hypothetical protein